MVKDNELYAEFTKNYTKNFEKSRKAEDAKVKMAQLYRKTLEEVYGFGDKLNEKTSDPDEFVKNERSDDNATTSDWYNMQDRIIDLTSEKSWSEEESTEDKARNNKNIAEEYCDDFKEQKLSCVERLEEKQEDWKENAKEKLNENNDEKENPGATFGQKITNAFSTILGVEDNVWDIMSNFRDVVDLGKRSETKKESFVDNAEKSLATCNIKDLINSSTDKVEPKISSDFAEVSAKDEVEQTVGISHKRPNGKVKKVKFDMTDNSEDTKLKLAEAEKSKKSKDISVNDLEKPDDYIEETIKAVLEWF